MAKKSRLKVPEKISGNEIRRQHKKMSEEIAGIRRRDQNNFQTLFLLATKLYIATPNDAIFTNGTFNDQFLETIEKGAKGMQEAARKKAAAPVAQISVKAQEPKEADKKD